MDTPDVFAGVATHVVFTGGPPPTDHERSRLVERLTTVEVARTVAADSGLALADALGVGASPSPRLDVVLGDMDSVDPDRLERAAADGSSVERFPADKDATDLELALDDAAAHAAPGDRLVVVGTTSGRFDHVLATLLVLSGTPYDAFLREAWLGGDTVHVVRGARPLPLGEGTTFSVLPVHGDAVVTARGVRWELHAERLPAGTSRGVSNVAARDVVGIEVTDGTALVVVPSEQPSEPDRSQPERSPQEQRPAGSGWDGREEGAR
jgi:thiamine pyrophosphokinase